MPEAGFINYFFGRVFLYWFVFVCAFTLDFFLFMNFRMIGYAIGPYLIAVLNSLPTAIYIAPFVFKGIL